MKKDCERIVLCKGDYNNIVEFWEDVRKLIEILSKNHTIKFYYEDFGVYCLEFNRNKAEGGYPTLEWVNYDEYIAKEREDDDDDE